MLQVKENVLDDALELLLEHWGQWVKYGNRLNLGYSKISNISLIAKNGGMNIRGSGHRLIEDDVRAQEMERLIIELSHKYPREAEAVKRYYTSHKTKFEIANMLKISYRTLNERLRAAKIWLDGRISKEFLDK